MKFLQNFFLRKVANRPNLKKIINNVGWLFFDRLLRMGMGLFVGIWIARYLGPERFGLLNFALAYVGIFTSMATLGLQEIVVRDIVRDREGAGLTLGTAVLLQFLGGIASFILICLSIFYLRPEDSNAREVVIVLGALMIFKAGEVSVYWYESQVMSKYTVWVYNSTFLLFSLIKIALIIMEAPLIAFAWAIFWESIIASITLMLVMSKGSMRIKSLAMSLGRGKQLLKDSWPLILSSISITLYMKIDQIMIAQMIGDEAAGFYSAAIRISEFWYFIPMAISSSVLPAILESRMQSKKVYMQRLQSLYDLMVLISLSVALPMTFLALPVVRLLFGDAYAQNGVGIVLSIHIWSGLFVFLGVASGKWFLAENRQILGLQRVSIGAFVNILLNLFLIPKYGPIGAAIATVFSQALVCFFFDLLQSSTRPMFFMKLKSMNPARLIKYFQHLKEMMTKDSHQKF